MPDDEHKRQIQIESFRPLDDDKSMRSQRPLDNRPVEDKPVHVGPVSGVTPAPEPPKKKKGDA